MDETCIDTFFNFAHEMIVGWKLDSINDNITIRTCLQMLRCSILTNNVNNRRPFYKKTPYVKGDFCL
jgi:hypothetical protein